MTIHTRLAVVTDGHWGDDPNGTSKSYQELHDDMLDRINIIHNNHPIDYLVHNGDLVYDDETLHSDVITNFFDRLPAGIDWYPVFGNHDWATDDEWKDYYGVSKSYTFENDLYGFVVAETGQPRDSESAGNYTGADARWLESAIDGFADKENVFVFMHIAPFNDTDQYGTDDPDVRTQLARDEVRVTFLGHNHDKNGVETNDGGTYAYCGRYGGFSDTTLGLRLVDLEV